ncbi:MAG TPA: M13 family metallopeptidase, partial [Flavisolibacter sp.]
ALFLAFAPSDKKPKKFKYIDKVNMDLGVRPGDNFYLYANGNWLKHNPVPATRTRWGSFDMLREESSRRLHQLLKDAAANAAKDPSVQKIGDFFTSGMDSIRIEQLGYQPIKPELDRISRISTMEQLLELVAANRKQGISSGMFGFSITPDRKNVQVYIPVLAQGGTTLPDRDYYWKTDARSTTIRNAFRDHLVKMFALAGDGSATAQKNTDAVMRIETALAKAQLSRVEMRDPYRTYNKFSLKDLTATTPGLDWRVMFDRLGLAAADSVIVNNPSFFKSLDILLTAVPLDDWKTYLKWQLINSAAPSLSNAFVQQNFAFNRVMSGQRELQPRWQRISTVIDGSLGDLLGKLYVDRYFRPEAKERMLQLVNNLQAAFADRIRSYDWMGEETKTKAMEKLNAFARKIGYPDTWRDYGSITIDKNDYYGNVRRVAAWNFADITGRFGKPVDKTRWTMTPPTINAYYNASYNEIVFPAGILQFPFFDFGADDAVNYGGIGAVIGHEMTHGFDDNGSQYAADGNLKNWWTNEDAEQFKKRTALVVNQYNNYTVLDTIHVNGKLTLGENIADLGGLNIAYEAFTRTEQFRKGKKIDGFTPAQRFFLSWAQIWRYNAVPETQAQLILTDTHSPGMYRTNGPIVNMDAWYAAFNIQPGDKMFVAPENRIRIW